MFLGLVSVRTLGKADRARMVTSSVIAITQRGWSTEKCTREKSFSLRMRLSPSPCCGLPLLPHALDEHPAQQVVGFEHAREGQAVIDMLVLAPGKQYSFIAQYGQLLGDIGLGDAHRFGQVAGRPFARAEKVDDLESLGVGEHGADLGVHFVDELAVFLFCHGGLLLYSCDIAQQHYTSPGFCSQAAAPVQERPGGITTVFSP